MTARQLHRVRTLWPVDEVSPGGAPAWTVGAPCRYQLDLFFSANDDDIAAAKAICTGVCPLERRIACMDYAFDNGIEHGVWGGVSRDERIEKYCGRCEQLKSVGAFGSNIAQPDGLNRYCRECTNAAARARANKPPADDTRTRVATIASLRSKQLRAAALEERMALYERLWWDQKMPRSVVMQQLGIKARSTAQQYEKQIREQKAVMA